MLRDGRGECNKQPGMYPEGLRGHMVQHSILAPAEASDPSGRSTIGGSREQLF